MSSFDKKFCLELTLQSDRNAEQNGEAQGGVVLKITILLLLLLLTTTKLFLFLSDTRSSWHIHNTWPFTLSGQSI